MIASWCPECGTAHGDTSDCPGSLEATGQERRGRRVHVETREGMESIGILVAPVRDGWRARIMTFPNVLWSVPGGRTSMKFVGMTAREAEDLAMAYVDDHCRRRGITRRTDLRPFDASSLAYASGPASLRKHRAVPLRFGSVRADRPGITVNLSETGLFVATADPLEPGTAARLRIDIDDSPLRLDGLVVWHRRRREPGRSLGMGLRLDAPPASYLHFWQTLP